MDNYDRIVGNIYDCAANPELWPTALESVKQSLDAAFVLVGLADFGDFANGGPRNAFFQHTEWDRPQLEKMIALMPAVPGVYAVYGGNVDVAWSQMSLVTEQEFHKSPFYTEWVRPQRLRDSIAASYLERDSLRGMIAAPSFVERDLYSEKDKILLGRLTPHIRRAISINDIVDKGKLALALHRKVLDALSVAVFVVGPSGKLAFANAGGEAMLSAADLLRLSNGRIAAARADITGSKLDDAIARSLKGDSAAGLTGIGVPLCAISGERASAYVLPIAGSDLRGQLGQGHAAVFIAGRGEQQPMALEILRTVFDLTPTEAKVAYATSLGDSPDTIASTLGSAIETVRSHLKRIYVKADVADKTALAARVNALMPPVTGK
jgi:DNA-binding CsgD family transcriptional regulator